MIQGRPMALIVLFVLSLLNLSSEWPSNVARPSFVSTLDETLPDSFKTARQLLFDQYQRHDPRLPTAQPVTATTTAAHHGIPGIPGIIERSSAAPADRGCCSGTRRPYRLSAERRVTTW